MSMIVHRCTRCRYIAWAITDSGASCQGNPCGCRCAPGEPELIPTFDLAGQPVERVVKPGCKALYAELDGAAA